MAYRFQRDDRSVTAAVRRIAAELIDQTEETLARPDLPLPDRIHTARKAVKKLRGLIRIVRPCFDDYKFENDQLREVGQTISSLREAHVALATLESLAQGAGLDSAALQDLSQRFEIRAARAEAPEALAERQQAFLRIWQELAARAPKWKLRRDGFDALQDGLARSFEAAVAAEAAARRGGDPPEAVHLWRKRVKDHGYQVQLLQPIWPGMMRAHGDAVDRLGESLGLCQDIAVLAAELPDDANGTRLREAGQLQLAQLLAEAHPLSRRLFAGSPKAFTARMRALWRVWQKGRGGSGSI